ncbi:hypothetical protein QBC47DRAFT_301773 [Echria macrotheca]|uniref:Heavy metal tolerance protein n=1 Tax=Echria macrotheca TaxID=438768 RepID=A0AAJ0BDN6_9PEZI|nr:hypothetical protein QBC47DRAFT_301773 [Echria macrotheca]
MLDPYDADLTEQQASGAALASLHYAYPITVFSYYMVSSTIAICTLQTSSSEEAHPRRRIIKWLLLFCVLSYLVQLLAMLVEAITQKTFDLEQDVIINLLSCILVFGLEFAGLSDSPKVVWHPIIGSIGLALVFEPIIECLSMLSRPSESILPAEFLDIGIVSVRYLAFALATVFYFEGGWNAKKEKGTDSERQGLLGADGQSGDENGSKADQANEQQNGYGTNASSTTESSGEGNQTATTERPESPWERRQREAREQMEKRLKEKGNWFTYAKSFLVFLPYIWPVNNKSLQVRIGLVGICLLTMNFVNVLIPRQLGILMDSLGGINDKNPWTQVLIFGGLKLVASEAGISLLRQWLWIPVEYYSYDAMSTAAYSHVLNLSSDFHDSKSSSDIMMAINSGQSISNMLDSLCFRAIPMLIDMVVAFIYLSVTFGPYEGFITIATSVIFMYIATSMIARLKMARKGEVSAWFEEHYIRQAGIQGWTTVTCFNQIGHEEKRYSAAVKNRITKSQKVQLGYILSYAFQFLVLLCGLLAGAFLAVYQVTHGPATPGQFIMLLTYWAQLVAPLGFFAGLGKSISRDLIGAEQLLEIMQTKPSIVDKEGAPPLEFTGGQVQFDQVCFSYDDKKEILKNVSFTATPGMTVAFVGATGAGKSTILKLLDRFYDVTKGAILIDGQDIRDVSLSSLRTQIGVVPQAPVLFDDTVMNNVRYAKLDATDEEVFEACKAASIHEQILGFTDGYQTRVGERGIKLSGGELQRVAIARAILKKPAIVLLDEATSAVDTETEQRIQDALKQLCEGRTTFIVAHRLSTIMNADRIMVVTGGELVEEGSHEELIRANGKYAELWSRQIFVKPQDGSSSSSAAAEDNNNNNNKNKPANKDEEEEGGHGLVNDLPTEVAELELAKVKVNKKQQQQQQQQEEEATTATDAGAGSDDSDDSTSSSGDSEDSTDTLVTPGNKKEEV